MLNKKLWFGILVIVSVVGMVFTACDNDGNAIWSGVTTFSQLNGTWKSPPTANYNYQGINYLIKYNNYLITINSTNKTMSASGTTATTLSGVDINTKWESIKQSFGSMPNGISVSFNDVSHIITMTYNNYSETLTDNEITEMINGCKINQNGTEFKMSMGFGFGTWMGVELIFSKVN